MAGGLLAGGKAGDGENGDVIFLPMGLRRAGYIFCRPRTSCGSALEAEEFAGGASGFDDAIGEQGELHTLWKLEAGFRIGGIGGQPERQAVLDGNLGAGEIGRQMAGVGQLGCAS